MTPGTPIHFRPDYASWYRDTTGNEARHAAWDGWVVDSGATARWLGADGQQWLALEFRPPLVLLSSWVLYGTCLNVPARFVWATGQGAKIVQLELWSEAA